MFEIRNACEKDLKSIKNICEKSFKLTSLNIDKNITKNAGEYFFNHYVSIALEKYPGQCFVYEKNKNILGFIIYGVDNSSSIALEKKIGSIILVAVLDKEQDKKIGYNLIKYIIDLFYEMKFDLITVGTDSDNIAALSIYQKLGFKTILNWATLRLSAPYKKQNPDMDIKLKLEKNKTEIENTIDKTSFKKTNSYFYDRNIAISKIKNKIKKSISQDAENDTILFYKIYLKNVVIGFIIIRHDIYLSNHNECVFQRIEDIHVLPKLIDNNVILRNIIKSILNEHPFDIIEMLVPLNRYNLINTAINENFYFVHSATVLHHWRQ